MSGEDILVHYGLQNLSHLTEEHLVTVCPALLNQAVLPPCSTERPVLTDPTELHGESSCAEEPGSEGEFHRMVQSHQRPTYSVKDLSPDVNQLFVDFES